jgi:methionine biosynthesis protein MetW
MLRIGRHGIVSFFNYAHWRARWHLVCGGRMPMTTSLPEPWYSTDNIHPCTLRDFEGLCAELGLVIERQRGLTAGGGPQPLASHPWLSNLLSEQALFMISRRRHPASRRPAAG